MKKFPRQQNGEGGWTICPKFLGSLIRRIEEAALYCKLSKFENRTMDATSVNTMTENNQASPERNRLLTSKEMEDIKAIVSKWDYATEACIESYLLGVNRRRKAMFDFTHEHSIAVASALSMWETENTPPRERAAFKDGYHAAMMDYDNQ